MFKPDYSISPRLLKNINEIERLYGQLEATQAPQSLRLNLERDNLIQSSFSSNSIEGNPLTLAEVTNLLLGDRLPANRDEKEVTNYFNLLKNLDNQIAPPINLNLIQDIHRKLLKGVAEEIGGRVRNKAVVVGGYGANNQLIIKHNPPTHNRAEIEKMLDDLCAWLGSSGDTPILRAGLFHHQIVFIHPFIDGNGRVCRLLTALILLKNRYLINKYFILDDYYNLDRDLYSDKLHSADTGNTTEWLEYFTQGIKVSLQSALVKIEKGLSRLTFDIRPTKRENEALQILEKHKEISSSDLAEELQITRQQGFNLLKSLVKKGLINKIGKSRASHYVLK